VSTPKRDGLHQPAEWAPHDAVWLAWPSHDELWGEDALIDAQTEFVALATAIADPDDEGTARGERLEILVRTDADERLARWKLSSLFRTGGARAHRALYGDIWLRDTLPIFLTGPSGARASVRFRFNGWGDKYSLPGDAELSSVVADLASVKSYARALVLEGGSVEVDGEGTILTTRQCLLNPNRNPGMSEDALTTELLEGLGGEKVLWLGDGLLNDHTDGHIDTIARFVAPGRVVCMAPSGENDPNAAILDRIASDLAAMHDARGRALEVIRIPSPGLVEDEDGDVMPASYVNFYIGNRTVVVPTYGTPFDAPAVLALAKLFPSHRVVGSSARTILEGGGAFHCITQQVPR
jgi:agmatine deiminase